MRKIEEEDDRGNMIETIYLARLVTPERARLTIRHADVTC